MTEAEILEQLELFTISEALDFSLLSGASGERFAVVKTSSGTGATEPLQDVMDELCSKSKEVQQSIYDSFNTTSQVMGGRPCK